MAKIITLQVLVDEDAEGTITNKLLGMLQAAATPDAGEAYGWLVDWKLLSDGWLIKSDVPAEIHDAICNETYVAGDAFEGNMALPDADYVLSDSTAWFTVGNVSLRVTNDGETLNVYAFPYGQEDGVTIADMRVDRDLVQTCIDHRSPESEQKFDLWMETYKPHMATEGSVRLYETFGEDLDAVKSASPECVWTLVDCDGLTWITPGFHFVNRMNYIICEVPCVNSTHEDVPY